MDDLNIAEDLKGSESRIYRWGISRNLDNNALFAHARAFAAEKGANVENLNSFFGGSAGNADEKHLSGNEFPFFSSVALDVYNLHASLKLAGKKLNIIISSDNRYGYVVNAFLMGHTRYKAFDVVAAPCEQPRDS